MTDLPELHGEGMILTIYYLYVTDGCQNSVYNPLFANRARSFCQGWNVCGISVAKCYKSSRQVGQEVNQIPGCVTWWYY